MAPALCTLPIFNGDSTARFLAQGTLHRTPCTAELKKVMGTCAVYASDTHYRPHCTGHTLHSQPYWRRPAHASTGVLPLCLYLLQAFVCCMYESPPARAAKPEVAAPWPSCSEHGKLCVPTCQGSIAPGTVLQVGAEGCSQRWQGLRQSLPELLLQELQVNALRMTLQNDLQMNSDVHEYWPCAASQHHCRNAPGSSQGKQQRLLP